MEEGYAVANEDHLARLKQGVEALGISGERLILVEGQTSLRPTLLGRTYAGRTSPAARLTRVDLQEATLYG